MAPQRSTGLGLGLAVMSSLTFATSGTFARSLIDAGWSAEAAVAARVAIGALVLAVPAALALRRNRSVLRRGAPMIAAYGVFAIGAAQVSFFNAVRYLPIGIALLLEYLGIVLVVLWMWVVHRQRPHRLTVAGSVAAAIGLAFVLDVTSASRPDPVGVLWGLGAGVGLASFFVLSARADADLPPTVLASGGMAVAATALTGLGLLGAYPLDVTFHRVVLAGHQVSWLVPVLGLSVVAAGFSYVAGIAAARILGARLASFIGLTEVLFAILIAWVALDQLPTGGQLIGGLLILAGVTLVRLDERRRPEAAPVLDADGVAGGERVPA
ncbi:MAG TPA: EamA family transporter [Micromonosporaceae bacterium]|nr:EamA family transporter [Micromonosporaceae bacterium]